MARVRLGIHKRPCGTMNLTREESASLLAGDDVACPNYARYSQAVIPQVGDLALP